MARGHNDYGVPDYSYFAVETPVSDVVAERQGFSRLDNRGRVLWFEDWRNGLSRWDPFIDGGASNPAHFIRELGGVGFHGIVSLDPVVTDGECTISNKLMLPVSARLGVEIGLFCEGDFSTLTIYLGHIFSSTQTKLAQVFINAGDGAIKVRDATTTNTIVTPASIGYFANRFMTIKFVVDFSINKYVRLMVGNTQYDLSNYTLQNWNTGFVGDTLLQITAIGGSGTNVNNYDISYVIISGDEP